MKVAQLHGHHPGRCCRPNTPPNCRSCRARRRRWAGPSSSGACRPSSAPTGRANSHASSTSPAAAASLGQVHRAARPGRRGARLQAAISRHAVGGRGRPAAARMAASPSTAAWTRRSTPREIAKEIGARVREELDYRREARHVALYRAMLAGIEQTCACRGAWPELSTGRLLTLDWLEGEPHARAQGRRRSRCATGSATAMFKAWWFPFSRFGVIHGDPHLGNYTVFERGRRAGGHQPARLRLHPHLPAAVSSAAWSTSISGLLHGDDDLRRARLRDLGLPAACRAS